MISDNVLVQSIIVIGSVITTLITVKYTNGVKNKNKAAPPRDRMDTIFEGYEKLITQQQEDIERKTSLIQSLEGLVEQLRKDLDKTTGLLERARTEVREAKESNKEMARQLGVLKQDYKTEKL